MTQVPKVRPASNEIVKFLEGVVAVVEATNCEADYLWRDYHCKQDYKWVSNLSGFGCIVGQIGDMPIFVSLLTNEVGGEKILFIHATSQVVDHRVIDAWLDMHLPEAPRTDARNFGNILTKCEKVTHNPDKWAA